jgi:ribosomal protein S18 acetylase RimI-like enzyme
VNADAITDALVQDGDRLATTIDGAFTQSSGDAGLLITGVAFPTLNGVLTVRTTAKADDVNRLLDVAARQGLPHSLLMRPGCSAGLVELVKARGFVEDESIPLMAMERDLERVREAASRPDLEIRLLEPNEAGLHAAIGAEGFDAPLEAFERLIAPAALRLPGFRAYVGFAEGEPVTTAVGSTIGDYVGIFDVATPERYRGRGYGSAVTAHAALDGFESGAAYAYLQSSPMGFKIYERLGFETLEVWSVWVSVPLSRS